MNYQFILFSVEGQVAKITLNRPAAFNSFIIPMAKELQAALDSCAENPEIRAIYLTGAGKAFCAGEDLNEAISPDVSMKQIVEETYNPIILRLRQIEKPIVAAVNGVAAGAGANIALACDICVAAEGASFIQAFSKIGLIPDSAGKFFLPRLNGMQRATALMMLGEKVSAQEAQAMGMIYQSYPNETFVEESWKLATTLAAMPTKGLGYTKRLLNLSFTQDLSQQVL
jgi:2-(1,2-epoxy-1,2-dihydrophenyl)acetyl-CoA isomerase